MKKQVTISNNRVAEYETYKSTRGFSCMMTCRGKSVHAAGNTEIAAIKIAAQKINDTLGRN